MIQLCAWVPLTGTSNSFPASTLEVPIQPAIMQRGRIGTGVSTLRAAKPKLHDSVPACGEDDTGGFGRDQALVVDDI